MESPASAQTTSRSMKSGKPASDARDVFFAIIRSTIEARRQVSQQAADHHEDPERGFALEPEHRQGEERRHSQAHSQHNAGEEEIGRSARIVDAGPHQALAQDFHVFAVDRRIMLRRIVDELLRRSQSGIAQRTPAAAPRPRRRRRAPRGGAPPRARACPPSSRRRASPRPGRPAGSASSARRKNSSDPCRAVGWVERAKPIILSEPRRVSLRSTHPTRVRS